MSTQTTLSLFLYSFYTMTDTFFLAKGVGVYAAGGVSLVAPVTILIGAVSSTLGAGGASIISRALGKNDIEKAGATAGNVMALFWLSALVVSALGLLYLDTLVRGLGADETLEMYSKDYLRIILIGAVTSTGFSSLIRAEGNTKYSLYIWMYPVLVNLVFDPIFIFGFGWGVKGAAIATVMAQIVSFGMSIFYFFSRRDSYFIRKRHFKPNFKIIVEVISIGLPTLISQISMSFFVVFVNKLLYSSGGTDAITAFGIVSRIQSFLILPQSGIVQGLQPIISYNYARKNYNRVKETFKWGSMYSTGYGFLITIIVLIFGENMVGMFITDDILNLGVAILKILSISYSVKGIPVLISSIYQSVGKPFKSVGLLFFGILIIQVPMIVVLNNYYGLVGIWYGFCISDLILTLISFITIIKDYKKINL
ncbi:MAG: MATE family efflux transporter [Lachnospirales bacterium]